MFSTFTGNSRRPRNVNLSGGVGNPFANTSWSPAVASNTRKTLSDAQADREKRQADRQRLKAASRIQRTWRGHSVRSSLADHRRASFDELYRCTTADNRSERTRQAFRLLVSFCRPSKPDDFRRLLSYVNDVANFELVNICPENTHPSRLRRLVEILVAALLYGSTVNSDLTELRAPLRLVARIIQSTPQTLTSSRGKFFASLAQICQRAEDGEWLEDIAKSIAVALDVDLQAYTSLASEFLTRPRIVLFEKNIHYFASFINVGQLSDAIAYLYTVPRAVADPLDDLLWLLGHFVHLTETLMRSQSSVSQIRSIFIQLSGLSSEISARVAPKPLEDGAVLKDSNSNRHGVDPYLSQHILWLISNAGTSKILQDFAASPMQSSDQAIESTSLLAGYLLMLLQSFPENADDIRMRLFLEQVTTLSGPLPTVKFLWRMVQETTVFQILRLESEPPIAVLKRYFQVPTTNASESAEDREWRVILLFLELYTFILRLSDDEDFFSGIHPSPLKDDSSLSRIQACSLTLEDVQSLTLFLKNVAFTLYYRAREVSPAQRESDTVVRSLLDSYFGGHSPLPKKVQVQTVVQLKSTKLEFDSLREIVSSAMTMLYERDSRKPFLPKGHWLITDKLEAADFVTAVIAEEERQHQQDNAGSDDEIDDEIDEIDDGEDTRYPFDREIGLTAAGQRLSRQARLESLRTVQMRVMHEHRLAEMAPKLEILKHMPFAVPFDTRVMIFRKFIDLDTERRQGPLDLQSFDFARHMAQIRRGQLFEDAYDELYKIGDGLKDTLQITFVDQFDQPEAGIDGGGVTKEFLISVTSEAFSNPDDKLNMFTSSPEGLLYPNPISIDIIKESMREGGLSESSPEWRNILNEQLRRYEFLGRIIGKCLYEGILVDLNFAGFFLLKWPSSGPKGGKNYKGSINDLRDMDEELYKGMLFLKNYPGDVSELGIDFTVTDQVSQPGEPIKTVTKLLVAKGDQVYVTNDNRPLYISYMARHRLVVQPATQTAAFLRGLRAIISPSWLSMFNQSELQRLVGGDSSEIDIEDLRRNTHYGGLYQIGDDGEEHLTIKLFWKVVRKFDEAQRRSLLKYVSSTPRAPLLGFSQLRPRFSIRDGGADEERLPSVSTCVNLLKLPLYSDESRLREKLLYAITSGAGFDLS